MDSLHPGHGTCFHDSIGHRDSVNSVHDTLGEESIKNVNVTFVVRTNVKNTIILDIWLDILLLEHHATSPCPSYSPEHSPVSPLRQK